MKQHYFNQQKILFFFCLFFSSGLVFAQAGWNVDQTYNPKIIKTRDFFFRIDKSNGKFYFTQNLDRKILRQLNADGTVNENFNITTDGNILAITEGQNNKTYVGGDFTSILNFLAPKIIRINSDGTRDMTFIPDSEAKSVFALKELADGKLLVGRDGLIERLNIDGSIDSSFSTVTTNGIVYSLAVLPNGKILAGGSFTSVNGSAKNRIILLNLDGTVDASFNVGTGFNNDVYIVRAAVDGSFYVGGKFTTYKGTTVNRISKISNNGSLDSTFHAGNTGFNNDVWTIEFLGDSKPLIGGLFTMYKGISNNSILKLNTDGTIDNSFATGPADSNGYVYKIIINSPNDLLVSGTFLKYNSTFTNQAFLANNNGSVNNSFYFDDRFCMPGFSFNNGNKDAIEDYAYLQQPDGKILLGNIFFENKYHTLIRLNPDGTKDYSFNLDISSLPQNTVIWDIKDILIRPNGKIICSASSGLMGSASLKGLFQLNADGSLDNSFNTGLVNWENYSFDTPAIGLQDDGKLIYFLNDAYTYRGYNANGAIRILENGNVDITFQNIPGSFSTPRVKILPLPNGKILIYNFFKSSKGYGTNPNSRPYSMVLLNSDGTLASRYENLTLTYGNNQYGYITNIKLFGDRLIVCGSFNKVNLQAESTKAVEIDFSGNPTKYFTNLDNGTILNSAIFDVEKQGDKYYFMLNTYWNEDIPTPLQINSVNPLLDYANYQYKIIRANENGIRDNTFSQIIIPAYSKHFVNENMANFPTLLPTTVTRSPFNLHIKFTGLNKLNLFAPYTSVSNNKRYGLSNVLITDNLSNHEIGNNSKNVIYPNPTTDYINFTEEVKGVKVFDMSGKLLKSANSAKRLDISNLQPGIYTVIITDKHGKTKSTKIIKK